MHFKLFKNYLLKLVILIEELIIKLSDTYWSAIYWTQKVHIYLSASIF